MLNWAPPGGFASPKPVLAPVCRSFLPCWETIDSFIFARTAKHMAGLHASPCVVPSRGQILLPRSRKRCHRLGLIKSIVSPDFSMSVFVCRGLMCCPNREEARGRGEAPASPGMLPRDGHRKHHPIRIAGTKSLHRAASVLTSPLKAFSITPEMEENQLSSTRAGRCPAEPAPGCPMGIFFLPGFKDLGLLFEANCDVQSSPGALG